MASPTTALALQSESQPRQQYISSSSTNIPSSASVPLTSHQQGQQQPPAVTITPASPSATPASVASITLGNPIPIQSTSPTAIAPIEMKEKSTTSAALPTDSKTALLNDSTHTNNNSRPSTTASKEATMTEGTDTNTTGRNPLSATPSAPQVTTATAIQEKPSVSTAQQPSSTNPTTSSPQTSSTSSKPSTTTKPTQRATQKKKRKRKGLAGLLLALGCLSASEFEDEPKPVTKSATTKPPVTSVATAPASSAAKTDNLPTAAAVSAAPPAAGPSKAVETPAEASSGYQADATATTSSNLVATDVVGEGIRTNEAAVQPDQEVVLAPVEPHILPEEETAGVTSSAVQPPGGGSSLLGTPIRPHAQRRESETAEVAPIATQAESSGVYAESDAVDESHVQTGDEGVDDYMDEEYEDEEDRLIEQGGMGIPIDENGHPAPLLPTIAKVHTGRKCLVLDLDETLLHSSFKSLPTADYIVPVEIESQIHNVYVIKRPGVDNFLKEMGKIYEIVVFTASLSKYADPVLDMLDTHGVVTHRLFRESCYNHKGNYVKDLSQLGRDIETSIIIDNSPASYIFHPNNAVPVSTWFNDPHDTELTDLCPFLADLATVDDVRGVLDGRLVYSR